VVAHDKDFFRDVSNTILKINFPATYRNIKLSSIQFAPMLKNCSNEKGGDQLWLIAAELNA
jgi:hypothetical protein